MLRTYWPPRGLPLPCLLLTICALTVQMGHSQPSTGVALTSPASGSGAVSALGTRVADIARAYGLTGQRLTTLLQTQPSLGVDRQGKMFFACPVPATHLVQAAGPAGTTPTGPASAQATDAFQLHSFPGASKVIYLDFTGHTTAGTIWNASFTGGADIISGPLDLDNNPSDFNTAERALITAIWRRVAEDYAPFAVDVTTQDPGVEALRKTTAGDQNYGVRVVISPTNWYNPNAGGVAYVGSFDWNQDAPAFVFTEQLANGEKFIAEATSHEVGHSVGLNHDGLIGPNATEYFTGHGDWAPIMGVAYYRGVSQFSRGEYANPSNTEDDLAIIAGYIPYAVDDHGNTTGTASTLVADAAGVVADGGTIERSTDLDVFRFSAASGPISLTLQTPSPEANLNLSVELINSSGVVLETSNPVGMSASIVRTLTAGTYYLRVRGVGDGDPLTNGYSSYGSIGDYIITGNLVSGVPPIAVASANPNSGTAPLTVNFSSVGSNDPDGTIVSYSWTLGNGATSTAANPSYTYPSAGSFTATLTVTDNTGLTASAAVAVTVNPAPVAPQITTQPVSQTVNAGATVTFSAAASGTPAPTFQWRKDGNPIAGATTASLTLANVQSANAGSYTLLASNSAGSATSNPAVLTVSSGGSGLLAEYFNNMTLSGPPAASVVEPTIDRDWLTAAPPYTAPDFFSVRWSGFVRADLSATYTFITSSDDGVRLWINNQLIIDNWTDHSLTDNTGSITLQAGQLYALRMEFYENTGGATARLRWEAPALPREVVPASNLFTASNIGPPKQ
ncbi:MAG: immunoglobulin domain-containing protein [Opitutaceae bacterium]|nr:immunoglobulin domain-containing protein [Opitutaceae bacterium]